MFLWYTRRHQGGRCLPAWTLFPRGTLRAVTADIIIGGFRLKGPRFSSLLLPEPIQGPTKPPMPKSGYVSHVTSLVQLFNELYRRTVQMNKKVMVEFWLKSRAISCYIRCKKCSVFWAHEGIESIVHSSHCWLLLTWCTWDASGAEKGLVQLEVPDGVFQVILSRQVSISIRIKYNMRYSSKPSWI